ncbi:MAG TPA: alpha/beta fold hydrolase [Candidatus Dormibacteraeota bacterium]|nr:alpha/beta fold hydrolase [Candidatus Dormibacteraeota bacterium]
MTGAATVHHPHPELPLTVALRGEGRPALVLHGGAGPDSMTAIVDHLAQTHHVLAPTHPGWDGTPRPSWFAGVDGLVETYLDLIDDLGLHELLVLGSSFGGWVAAEIAVRDRGRRLSELVLVDAIGPVIPGQSIAVPGGPPPGPGAGPRRGLDPRNMQALAVYAGSDTGDPKLLSRLSRVKARTLLLWGDEDVVVAPEFGRAYAGAIPGARFELIEGGGHIPTREQPEATLAALDRFLSNS